VLEQDIDNARRAFLLAHDTDPFNRWEAGRELARATLLDMIENGADANADYLSGLKAVVSDTSLDPAYRALMLAQPSENELAALLADQGKTPDPDAIHKASEALRNAKSNALADILPELYAANQVSGDYAPDAEGSGKRALANAAMSLLTRLDGGASAATQYAGADNMTLQLAALAKLIDAGKGAEAIQSFYDQWKHDHLVINKWFALQIAQASPDDAAHVAKTLTEHPDFTMTNPNRFRATLGALAGNHAGFHHASGKGYALLADWLIKLDPLNPQTTARMCTAFQTWARYDDTRKAHAKAQLERILATPDLSRDTTEMITRILG
jgi:aminopeptidase N